VQALAVALLARSGFSAKRPTASKGLRGASSYACFPVRVHLSFRSRRAGSFGTSSIGRVAEWVTTTWLRFTCALFVVVIVLVAILSPMAAGQKLMLIVFAPIAALFYWYGLLVCLLICRFLGTFGAVLAHILVIYLYIFSALVVQPPPTIDLRLTRH
jgi:sterol desaturase/sphingolipid hydroxylase (fatty acid hydroxylase superfamily)